MNKKHVSKVGKYIGMACLLFVCATVQSCRDEYYYDDREPDFLGSSIYDYLDEQGNFTHFLQVINDLGEKEVLKKTGSKTLFVADDEAFMRGIKAEWGFDSYAQLTPAHKRIILYSAMLDNAYLLEMLSKLQSTGINAEPVPGKCLRRVSSASVVDTIGLFAYKDLPKNNPDWERFRDDSVRLALDATQPMMLHFIQDYLYQNGITQEDLGVMVNDFSANWSDIYIYDKKVIKDRSDVTCKNGYVHQLDGLLIPPSNMAEELRVNANKDMLLTGELDLAALKDNYHTTMLFSRMLDRFAVPVPIDEESEIAETFHRRYVAEGVTEQLYEKRYYTDGSERGAKKEDGFKSYVDVEENLHEAKGSLFFDPGWNAFKGTSEQKEKEVDMAAIFAPSDAAVISFFTQYPSGKTLIDKYGVGKGVVDPYGTGLLQAIDSIDLDILQALVRNHMQMSFVSAVPSKFELVVNDARDPMNISKNDVSHTILANNGVIYVMNKLYPPARYESVIAPVDLDDSLAVFNKFIVDLDYDKYLLSMGNKFTLIAPSDTCMVYYAPDTDVKGGTGDRDAYYFKKSFNSEGNLVVQALVYKYKPETYNVETNTYTLTKGSSTRELDPTKSNLLKEIMEYNIVLGDVNSVEDQNSGKKYYMSKGYGTVKVQRGEDGYGLVTGIAGGRELQNGAMIPILDGDVKEMKNGQTVKLRTSMVQPPVQSVYNVLSTTPEFQEFYSLCMPNPEVLKYLLGEETAKDEWNKYRIFDKKTNLVRMFDTYHYTVYVPDSTSLFQAYEQGLPNWETLVAEMTYAKTVTDKAKQDSLKADLLAGVELLTKFVRYHFQDNSVYADIPQHVLEVEGQAPEYQVNYETAALNGKTGRFCSVLVQSAEYNGKQTIAVRGDFGEDDKADLGTCVNACYVVNQDPALENKLYNVMTRDIIFKGSPSWDVSTSSYAAVHQINGCLKFGGEGGIYDKEKSQFIR